MSWKTYFKQGTLLFKQGKYSEALEQFTYALANDGKNQFIIYDSRAAVYECLNNPKDALSDAKNTIQVAPQRWQGYARAARLFVKAHKPDAALKMIEVALSRLAEQAHSRRDELLGLKQEAVDLKNTIAERERLMQNFMLKMPVEIYGEIFHLVLTEDSTQIFTLLHICAHWRQIVWDTPGLWHTLVLSKSSPDKKASLWVERSRRRIRELKFHVDYEFPGPPNFLVDMNWAHLRTLKIASRIFHGHIDPALMFPGLEYLELHSLHTTPDEAYFRPATKLKSLSLREIRINQKHLAHHLPCLSSLNITFSYFGGQAKDFLGLLSYYPQLESLRLERVLPAPTDSDITQPGPITLPNLTSLEAIECWWASYILLLDIPALKILRLERHAPNFISGHFKHWLSTSPQFLTELSLKGTTVEKSVLVHLVQTVHSVEVLALTGQYDAANEVVNTLVEGSVPEGAHIACLCPRLRYLDVSNCPDVKTSTVHALVKQRLTLSEVTPEDDAWRVNTLEILKMDGCPQIDINWLPWFRRHVPVVSCIYATQKLKRGIAKRV